MSCSGDGSCLIQTLDAAYETNPDCHHNCQVDHCDLCETPVPTWIKDCNKGCCVNCATQLYCELKKRNEENGWDDKC